MPEILPPEKDDKIASPAEQAPIQIWGLRLSPRTATLLIKTAITLPSLAAAAWLLQNFLQLRNVVNLTASRIDLGFLVASLFVVGWVLTAGLPHKKLWRISIGVVLVVAGFVVDWLVPKPQLTNIPAPLVRDRPSGWRTIKDWQKAELAPVLEHYPNYTLHIVASSLSDETWDYATQFKEFFIAHKWKVIGPETAPGDQITLNMQLSISEQYWGKPGPEAFTALDSALQSVHIKNTRNFVVDPLVGPDELVMWIGPETPPGYPQHIPLQLRTICRSPLRFIDEKLTVIGSLGEPARLVRIFPSRSRFSKGDRLLVLLTGDATQVGKNPAFTVQALGKLTPRADALDVLMSKDFENGEPIYLNIISKTELRVRCVSEWFGGDRNNSL